MIQKLLKMNALLLDMLKTRDELNGDWKPEWDTSNVVWEMYFTGEGNIASREAIYKTFHPFYLKDKEACQKFWKRHVEDLEEYDSLLWGMK